MKPVRVALVYFRDPMRTFDGMDTIRWWELACGLAERGYEVEMVTRDGDEVEVASNLRVRRLNRAPWESYDVVKTTNHVDVFDVPPHPYLICRVGRVIDELRPERVHRQRSQLLKAQEVIARRARFVTLMSKENVERWEALYPSGAVPLLVANGCPVTLPPAGPSPYRGECKIALYFGSLTSSRFVERLNALGAALRGSDVELHHVGRNQLGLYGETEEALDPNLVISHPSVPERESWDYLHHADVALMFARSEDVFDNEISKVYYLLRAGIPTVSEQFVSTNTVIEEAGWGEVCPYGDTRLLAEAVARWASAPRSRRPEIGQAVAERHSWASRVDVYHDLFRRTIGRSR